MYIEFNFSPLFIDNGPEKPLNMAYGLWNVAYHSTEIE